MCTPLVEAAENRGVCWGGAWGAPAAVEFHLGLDFPSCLRGCRLWFGLWGWDIPCGSLLKQDFGAAAAGTGRGDGVAHQTPGNVFGSSSSSHSLVKSEPVAQELWVWTGRMAHSRLSLKNWKMNPPSSSLGLGSSALLLFLPLTFCSLPGQAWRYQFIFFFFFPWE